MEFTLYSKQNKKFEFGVFKISIISKLSNKQRNFLIFLILIPALFLSFLTLVKIL